MQSVINTDNIFAPLDLRRKATFREKLHVALVIIYFKRPQACSAVPASDADENYIKSVSLYIKIISLIAQLCNLTKICNL